MGAGFIPILGTMIDVAFKANLANLAILEAHMRSTPKFVSPSYVLAQLTSFLFLFFFFFCFFQNL